MRKSLGDQIFDYCTSNLDTKLGIAIAKLDNGSLITTHFNQVAAGIWAVPPPRDEIILRQIIGNSAEILFPKSQRHNPLFKLVLNPASIPDLDCLKLQLKDFTLAIGAWDDTEPDTCLQAAAFTDGCAVILLILAQQNRCGLGDRLRKFTSPEKITAFSEHLSDQAKAFEGLSGALLKWAGAIAGLGLAAWGIVSSVPGMDAVLLQSADQKAVEATEGIRGALKEAYHQLPNPQSYGLFYFAYSEGCRSRSLRAAFSPFLKEESLSSERATTERGWAEILAAHQQAQAHILKRSDYPEGNALHDLMVSLGVQEVLTVPVLSQSNCPLGYLASGYTQSLTSSQRNLNLEALDKIVTENYSAFPARQSAAPSPPRRQSSEDFVKCQQQPDGTLSCSVRARSPQSVPPSQ